MISKRGKSWWRSLLSSGWLFAGVLVLLLFFSVSLVREVMRKMEIKQEIKKLEEKISSLESDNRELESLIQYLQTEEFIEEEARAKLSLKKPGEKVVAVPENLEVNSNEQQLSSQEELSNWQLWWKYFFGNKN